MEIDETLFAKLVNFYMKNAIMYYIILSSKVCRRILKTMARFQLREIDCA